MTSKSLWTVPLGLCVALKAVASLEPSFDWCAGQLIQEALTSYQPRVSRKALEEVSQLDGVVLALTAQEVWGTGILDTAKETLVFLGHEEGDYGEERRRLYAESMQRLLAALQRSSGPIIAVVQTPFKGVSDGVGLVHLAIEAILRENPQWRSRLHTVSFVRAAALENVLEKRGKGDIASHQTILVTPDGQAFEQSSFTVLSSAANCLHALWKGVRSGQNRMSFSLWEGNSAAFHVLAQWAAQSFYRGKLSPAPQERFTVDVTIDLGLERGDVAEDTGAVVQVPLRTTFAPAGGVRLWPSHITKENFKAGTGVALFPELFEQEESGMKLTYHCEGALLENPFACDPWVRGLKKILPKTLKAIRNGLLHCPRIDALAEIPDLIERLQFHTATWYAYRLVPDGNEELLAWFVTQGTDPLQFPKHYQAHELYRDRERFSGMGATDPRDYRANVPAFREKLYRRLRTP